MRMVVVLVELEETIFWSDEYGLVETIFWSDAGQCSSSPEVCGASPQGADLADEDGGGSGGGGGGSGCGCGSMPIMLIG
jgi:hypothetical protein